MGFEKGGIDAVFLHLLEALSSITKYERIYCGNDKDPFQTKVEKAKNRIFWKTVREIADHESNDANRGSHYCLSNVLTAFPDKKKYKDKRMWLPMHFAMSVPNIDIEDIQTLFDHQPKLVQQQLEKVQEYMDNHCFNPCHLAVMSKNPNMALIERLKVFDPSYGSRLTCNSSTPLHLAAAVSTSAAVIREIIRVYPPALHMSDFYEVDALLTEEYPDTTLDSKIPLLCCVFNNHSDESPDILRALIDAAPKTVRVKIDGILPLHRFLIGRTSFSQICCKKVEVLIKAFPGALNIPYGSGMRPIHLAAMHDDLEAFKVIAEADHATVLPLDSDFGTVAHAAFYASKLENAHYIYSVMPGIFQQKNKEDETPLAWAVNRYCSSCWFIKDVASIAPEAAMILKRNGDNLLHTITSALSTTRQRLDIASLRYVLVTTRLLLRLIPGGALATNNQGQTPYDLLDPDNPDFTAVRRLLLLAGTPSLHPETRKQMNYEARRGALLAFFAPRAQHQDQHQSSGGADDDICHRIRHGAGATEIMRQISSFL